MHQRSIVFFFGFDRLKGRTASRGMLASWKEQAFVWDTFSSPLPHMRVSSAVLKRLLSHLRERRAPLLFRGQEEGDYCHQAAYVQGSNYNFQWSPPPVASLVPHRRRTLVILGCEGVGTNTHEENLCGKVFKVGKSMHRGNPTLSASEARIWWYGGAVTARDFLGCNG